MEWLGFFAIPFVLYAAFATIASSAAPSRRRFLLLALAIGVVWTLALFGFWAWAADHRGGGGSVDDELPTARLVFLALYAALLALAYGVGRAFGVARLALAAGIAFAVVTAYHVEYINACEVGKPVVWPGYIGCG